MCLNSAFGVRFAKINTGYFVLFAGRLITKWDRTELPGEGGQSVCVSYSTEVNPKLNWLSLKGLPACISGLP